MRRIGNDRADCGSVVGVDLPEHDFADGDLVQSTLFDGDLAIHQDGLRYTIGKAEVLMSHLILIKIYPQWNLVGDGET